MHTQDFEDVAATVYELDLACRYLEKDIRYNTPSIYKKHQMTSLSKGIGQIVTER